MGFFSNRRNKIVEDYLKQMVNRELTEADIPDLYFEAACKYAQENGATLYPDMRDSILFDKVIDGSNYSVLFMVGRRKGGTNVTLTKGHSAYDIARRELDINNPTAQNYNTSEYSKLSAELIDLIDRSLEEKCATRSMDITLQDIESLFQICSTAIPFSKSISDSGSVHSGFLEIPKGRVLMLSVVLIRNEAIINVPSTINPDAIEHNYKLLLEIQEEMFVGFCDLFRESLTHSP